MRERLAKALAALLTGVVVLMAAFFADRRNEADRPPPAGSRVEEGRPVGAPPSDPALVARGEEVFLEQACTRCHSAEGTGNPRLPLDGVGSRRSASELRDWATGSGTAREELGRSTARAKEGFARLPAGELDALVAYLGSLR